MDNTKETSDLHIGQRVRLDDNMRHEPATVHNILNKDRITVKTEHGMFVTVSRARLAPV